MKNNLSTQTKLAPLILLISAPIYYFLGNLPLCLTAGFLGFLLFAVIYNDEKNEK